MFYILFGQTPALSNAIVRVLLLRGQACATREHLTYFLHATGDVIKDWNCNTMGSLSARVGNIRGKAKVTKQATDPDASPRSQLGWPRWYLFGTPSRCQEQHHLDHCNPINWPRRGMHKCQNYVLYHNINYSISRIITSQVPYPMVPLSYTDAINKIQTFPEKKSHEMEVKSVLARKPEYSTHKRLQLYCHYLKRRLIRRATWNGIATKLRMHLKFLTIQAVI